MKNIIIIGNGISGITAARHIRKMSDDKITVISSESKYFFSRTALMYIYMGHMKFEHTQPYENWFWKKNKINLLFGHVSGVNTQKKLVVLQDGNTMQYDVLIIGSGSIPNKFGWPGQDLKGVQGMYHIQDVENMERYTGDITRAVIVGGGLIGIEMAEMLRSRNIEVTFLVRENSFWNIVLPPEESDMVNRHIREHHIDLRLNTELKKILPDRAGRAKAIVTGNGEEISCQFVGLTAGVSPNIGFLKNSNIETARGILVDEYLRTNVEDVYAIGDCAQFRKPLPGRRPIEQVWYTGRMQGETLAHTICGQPAKYTPGIWFNSAKFLDIEYQVYGTVANHPGADEKHLYWEHPGGRHAIRLVYHDKSGKLTGINLMGIRFRHEICDHWIRNGTPIGQVLAELKTANFDPEFFKAFEDDIIKAYNKNHPGSPITSSGRRGPALIDQKTVA